MREDFASEVARTLGISRRDLIEKDLLLHQILLGLSENKFFSTNFLFKGGTCLIKGYFGYLRFSEDIDFTWKDQKPFAGRSQKSIRTYLSKIIYRTGSVLEEIAAKRGLDFRCVKSSKRYVEFGGGNKNCTFKIWYQSEILKRQSFLKVQINFVEKICFPVRRLRLKSLLTGKHEDLEVLFPEYKEYSRTISFAAYDLREIFCEKIRALLTREGTKARDFLDAYLIVKKFGVSLDDVEDCIIEKMRFALRLYRKYRTNLKDKIALLNSGRLFEWGEERQLLLTEIIEKDYYAFLTDFQTRLKNIIDKI